MDTHEANWNDDNQDIAESVMWAADERKPLIVTTAKGETVRMVPETATEPAPSKPDDRLKGVTVTPVAEERSKVLHISGVPDLTNHPYGDKTITPSGVWIEYRQEEGEAAQFRKAHVSGYRAKGTFGPEPDNFTSITLNNFDTLPDWLTALIDEQRPA
jgi:hypothetical protein